MREALRSLRIHFGYTQEKMSEITGIERTKFTRIENGSIKNVSVNDAYLIAKALDTTIESIFVPEDVYEEHISNQAPTGTEG